ncbi:MAG TPA: heavy-metal-associated domain-containing protein [Candidatus Tripitaka californicus]|uniref:heavy-metal-associated domain-containing protein n=1 Tax=Candidatus Tripitaka californicus TaxID=3367616 RepID=UPI0040294777|nr:cation transporter [Planctomycetota bacterium]
MKTVGKVLVLTLAVSLVGMVSGGVLPFCTPASLAAEELEQVHMKVNGMTCGACAAKIKSNLTKLPEVKEADVNSNKGTADIRVAKGSNHMALAKAVQDAGFTVSSVECECNKGKK